MSKAVRALSHFFGPCGNVGCIKCFGINFSPFLYRGHPYRMPHWMWLRWNALSKDEQNRVRSSARLGD